MSVERAVWACCPPQPGSQVRTRMHGGASPSAITNSILGVDFMPGIISWQSRVTRSFSRARQSVPGSSSRVRVSRP